MTYEDAVVFLEQFVYLLQENIVNNKELVITREYSIRLVQALSVAAAQ